MGEMKMNGKELSFDSKKTKKNKKKTNKKKKILPLTSQNG